MLQWDPSAALEGGLINGCLKTPGIHRFFGAQHGIFTDLEIINDLEIFQTHRIHGTGIFTYMKTIKIN